MASTGAVSRRLTPVRDEEKETMQHLLQLFGNVLDYDLIQNVALNCNFHLETVSNILFEMTGTVKNVTGTPNSKTTSVVTPNKQAQADVLPKRIVDDIKNGYRVMIIMRGLPGSGKSTKAKEIIKSVMGTSNYDQHIFSADDYFISKRTGVYAYNSTKVRDAHEYVQNKVLAKTRDGVSPIIVDNTHTQMWEMKCYTGFATNFGYIIEIIEPTTRWAFNDKELARRNVHGVPRVKIQEMLDRYERNITSKELISSFHFSYKDLKPPVLRKFPPILKEQETIPPVCFTSQGNITKNGLSSVTQAQEQNLFPRAVNLNFNELSTNIASPKPTENLPLGVSPLKNKGTIELNATPFSFESGTVSFGTPKTETQALGNSRPLSVKSAFVLRPFSSEPTRLQETSNIDVPKVQINQISNTGNFGLSENFPKKETQALRNSRPLSVKSAFVLRPFSSESTCVQETSNIDVSKVQINQISNKGNFGLLENFPSSWKSWEAVNPIMSPVSNTSAGSFGLFENKSTTESSSNTLGSDFSILNNGCDNAGNVRIINTVSRDINEGVKIDQPRSVAHKITLDKSSMTSEAIVADNNQDIQELMTLFVGVPMDYLKDVYEKCGNNLNWTVDLLLDDNRDFLPVAETAAVQETDSLSDNEDTIPLLESVQESPLQDISASAGNEEIFAIQQEIQTLKTLFSNLPVDYLIDTHKRGGNNLDYTVDYILNNDNGDENKSMNTMMNDLSVTGEDERSKPPLRESEEIKKHIEENVIINKDYYSDHVLKIKDRQAGVCSSSTDSVSPSTSGTTEEFVFIERGNSPSEFEEEERMELNLGTNLISQLESKFGCLNMIPQGFQPVINIPTDLAKQLHAFYVESVFVQMENQTQVLEMLVKEDEEFAKKLQQQEEEHEDHRDSEPSNLNTIMKDQLASSLQQREIEEWIQQNSRDDLASRLTLHNLTSTFPSISKQIIMEILMAHNYSYDETVEVLRASIDSDDESPAPIPQEMVNEMKVAQENLEKECEADNYNKTAEEYREEAQMHLAKHNETLATAQQAYQRKQYQVAQFYSELAKSHTKLYEKANGMAAAAFIEQNASRLKELNVLDLHNLYVKEALQALDVFIDVNVNLLRESNRTSQELSIITGRGKHNANGRSKLRPAVQTRLRKRNIPFNNYSFNPGMIKIKINTYTVLTSNL